SELLDPLYTDFTNIELTLRSILRKIVDLDRETQENTLNDSMNKNIIAKIDDETLNNVFDTLDSMRQQLVQETPATGGSTELKELLNIAQVPLDLQEEFTQVYLQKGKDIYFTVEELRDNHSNFDESLIYSIINTFKLNELTMSHPPMIEKLLSDIKNQLVLSISEFSKLSDQDWINIINELISNNESGYPEIIEGEDEQEKISNYASLLYNNFLSEYPAQSVTSDIAAQAPSAAEAVSALQEAAQVAQLPPNIDIRDLNIEGVLEENQTMTGYNSIKISASAEEKLADAQKLQRAIRITTNTQLSKILYDENITAQKIYFMGESNFINLMKDKQIPICVSKQAYKNAQVIYSNLVSEFTRLNANFNKLSPSAVSPIVPSQQTLAQMEKRKSLAQFMGYEKQQMPMLLSDYTTLFGDTSYCQCEQCKSVHGASAYMVDILHFLSYRKMKNSQNIYKTSKEVLFDRRSDLGDIALNCQNANTSLLYIDLVCEILENAIIPKEDNYQTTKSEEELRANPEHVNDDVYKLLCKNKHIKKLPFNLYSEESRAYLNVIGIKLYELMELFASKSVDENINNKYMAFEYLKINSFEADIITERSSIDRLELNNNLDYYLRLDNFLKFMEIDYNQLKDLMRCDYINKEYDIEIIKEDNCKLDKQYIENKSPSTSFKNT
ncbi:MAG: hypothetical protein ACRDD7_10570, partial [Peptostreptococcaceae bacterium]